MAITRVKIKDFLIFKGAFTAYFCDGVNVFVGENGTGKTTLLKCFYAATDTIGYEASRYFDSPDLIKNRERIARIVDYSSEHGDKPDNLNAVAVYMSNSDEWGKIDNDFNSKVNKIASHSDEGKKLNDEYMADPLTFNVNRKSVYIPEKDILSNSKGLPESVMYGKAQFTVFDIDIITKARVLANTPEQPLYRRICEIIGGEPQNDGQSFFMKRPNNANPIPFSLEASGYRKFGLLAALIRNEQIKPGVTLLWDEPENSLNPELVPVLVDILLELSKSGVQIFLATHDYNLARYFDIRKDKNIPVVFHNLVKTDNGQIECKSSPDYLGLPDNLLEKASADLFEAVVSDAMGVQNDG
jgi:AAA15 family ATPase/GTPase